MIENIVEWDRCIASNSAPNPGIVCDRNQVSRGAGNSAMGTRENAGPRVPLLSRDPGLHLAFYWNVMACLLIPTRMGTAWLSTVHLQ